MPRYVVDRREGLGPDETPERIQTWLRANGHPAAEVISTGYGRNGNLRIHVESPTDPTADLMTYTPTPTAREVRQQLAMADGKAVLQAINQKPRADRTPVERALLALALKLAEVEDESA